MDANSDNKISTSSGTISTVSSFKSSGGARTSKLDFFRYLKDAKVIIWSFANVVFDYLYDLSRYLQFSGTLKRTPTRTQLKSSIIVDYHAIEKGLSLRNTRLGFGHARLSRLLSDIDKYVSRYGSDETVRVALSVLDAYLDFHKQSGCGNDKLERAVAALRQQINERSNVSLGGVVRVSSADLKKAARGEYPELVYSRHSIRRFSPDPVDLEIIRKSVALAMQAPSVCNRPSWKVRIYKGRAKDEVLALQHGNKGFGHEAPIVLIITGDLEYFSGRRERNQVFVDGGLFAMTLLYALHYYGLGACALNLCLGREVDRKLRRVANIPPSESFIMMVAVGHLDEEMVVTSSCRPPVDEVLVGIWE